VAVQFLLSDGEKLRHINGGVNKNINNLGKFALLSMIDYAYELNFSEFDHGPTDM